MKRQSLTLNEVGFLQLMPMDTQLLTFFKT